MDEKQLNIKGRGTGVLSIFCENQHVALVQDVEGGGMVIMSPLVSDSFVRKIQSFLCEQTQCSKTRHVVFAAGIKGRAERARRLNEHSSTT